MEAIARPLYAQVRDALVARIADGEWAAGTALPSEIALAAQIGVSQGTVRKALDAMAAENVVERRQGRGTYVREHTEARALFHFFPMQDAKGNMALPRPASQTLELTDAPTGVAAPLGSDRRKIWRLTRVREVAGRRAILEHIYLNPRRFPELRKETQLPNALYGFYQSTASVTVVRADDRLTATLADQQIAQMLDVAEGAPLLRSDRQARDLRNEVVEIRISWFDTRNQAYASTLR